MVIIERNAEYKLIGEISDCSTMHRCLFLKLSMISDHITDKKTELIEYVTKYFAEETAKLFISRNSDIFLLTRNTHRKQLSKFLSMFIEAFVPDPIPPGLAALFETNINDKKLIGMCHERIQEHKKEDQLEKKKQQKEEQRKQEQALLKTKIEDSYIASIPARRDEREHVNILLVEDDILTQHLVRNSFKKEYSITAAKNGYETIISYADIAPDIVFLDIGLPDISGHQLLVKLLDMDPDAFIVMLSGSGDRENIMKAVDAGAKGFIGKPFTKEKVLQYIKKSPHYISKTQGELS